VVSFVVLIRREMPRQAPLIPLDLLRGHRFRISIVGSVCVFAGPISLAGGLVSSTRIEGERSN